MCKTPRVEPVKEKVPQHLRNPLLDGLRIGAGTGRNSLRVDRTAPAAAPSGNGLTVPTPPPQPDIPGLVFPTIRPTR